MESNIEALFPSMCGRAAMKKKWGGARALESNTQALISSERDRGATRKRSGILVVNCVDNARAIL